MNTDHSEQSSLLEVWVELDQSWLGTGLPLNETTEESNTGDILVRADGMCCRTNEEFSSEAAQIKAQTMAKAQRRGWFSS